MNTDRLIEIETKLAFQEDALQTLSDVMTRQQQHIEQLEARLGLLTERLRQMTEEQAADFRPAHEKPPHY